MATKNRYQFASTLTGFINVFEDSGKFNNRTFSFKVPRDVLQLMEDDREELLDWARTKVKGRVGLNPSKWDDEGIVKYSYGGETGRIEPVFIDTEGSPLEPGVLQSIRRGTKVNVICQQTPYTKPNMGTTIKVLGVQVVELATGNGAVDSGDLSVEDIASMFGTTSGFKADQPMVRKLDTEETATEYEF